jgi:hypothetical protein
MSDSWEISEPDDLIPRQKISLSVRFLFHNFFEFTAPAGVRVNKTTLQLLNHALSSAACPREDARLASLKRMDALRSARLPG